MSFVPSYGPLDQRLRNLERWAGRAPGRAAEPGRATVVLADGVTLSTFDALDDVNLTDPATGDVPVYDGAYWVNQKWVHASFGIGTGAAPAYRLEVLESPAHLYFTATGNVASGLKGLHLHKTDAASATSHGISWDVGVTATGLGQWETGVDYDTNNVNERADMALLFDASANANVGADVVRVSHEADDTVAGSASAKFVFSHIAGSPRAFTSFMTIEAGDTLGGINLSVNNSASGRSAITITQRAADHFGTISFDGALRIGCDRLNANKATFFIKDDVAALLRLFMDDSGRFNIGTGTAPTAYLMLPPGLAAAGFAPFKLTSGTNLTTPEDGALEYDGTNLYYTIGSTRYPLAPPAVTAAVVTKTANYTVLAADGTVLGDASGGAFSVTLPTAVGCTGRIYTVKKTDATANAVTVATTAAQTIDGAATAPILAPQTALALQSDGSNWRIV